jgi:D-alanine-D-alanine ligase
MANGKRTVVVMFGGISPEHDVSIVTGLQVIDALDPELFEPVPLYVSASGAWYIGEELRTRATYIPGPAELKKLTPVQLRADAGQRPALEPVTASMFRRPARVEFDIALPAFHGTVGEDGAIQGLLETAGVPYTGMRTLACSVLMDKIITKRVLAGTGIPLLPCWEIARPEQGFFLAPEELRQMLPDVAFPCILKPCHLGSSIGVARVTSWDELAHVLPSIFRLDRTAMLEPFVENLVEYNVSVCRIDGEVRTSAIERPKHTSKLLDFKTKYLAGADNKSGTKAPGASSEGMLSLTRDINPSLPEAADANIRRWASEAFQRVDGSGAPRFDFLCNAKTGEIWLNEANPCPGSFAYFLWQAARQPLLFPQLLEHLIAEATALAPVRDAAADPTPEGARLFPRHT